MLPASLGGCHFRSTWLPFRQRSHRCWPLLSQARQIAVRKGQILRKKRTVSLHCTDLASCRMEIAAMARPRRKLLEEIRTRAWFAAVSKRSRLTVSEIAAHFEDKAWYKYRKGQHVPNEGVINRVERQWTGTKRFFVDGPANLFAAATVANLEQGYWLFKSSRLERSYRGILQSFLEQTQFHGAPEQCLISLADWLRKTARRDASMLPLAVSANLITSIHLSSDGLWKVILPSMRVFEERYGLCNEDLLRVHGHLLMAFVEQSRRLSRPIPQWALDEDAKGAFGGFPDVRARTVR